MTGPLISKRGILLGSAGIVAASALPRTARAEDKPLTVVLESEAVILDPHMTTAAITRTFSYHIWDTLFSQDEAGAIQPQMVDRHETSADGLTWKFTLREGLKFHDGAPVTGADCVASLQRWAPRDSLGRMMLAAGAAFAADGERGFTITLKKPFPLMLPVLGKPNAPVPAMMPARVIAAAGTGRIKDIIGSGPFRFRPDLLRTGDVMTISRFDGYVPRKEPPSFLAGGKVVHVADVVMRVLPDATTGANALMAGEVDYMQYLPYDLVPQLEKAQGVKLMTLKGLDMFQGNFRLNHASGPFADQAVRQVLWKLVSQKEMLQAAGIQPRFAMDDCASFWMCGTTLSTDAGAGVAKYDLAAAKAELARTAYKGEPVIMMQVNGSISQAAGSLLAQNMREAGFTVDEQVMDWGTVLSRRAKKEGWSLFPVYSNGVDMASPLNHFYVANNCADYPGWSCSPAMGKLLEDFAAAPDDAARKKVAADIQKEAYQLVPSVMWGQFARPAGYRTRLQDLIQSSFPIFWNVRLASA